MPNNDKIYSIYQRKNQSLGLFPLSLPLPFSLYPSLSLPSPSVFFNLPVYSFDSRLWYWQILNPQKDDAIDIEYNLPLCNKPFRVSLFVFFMQLTHVLLIQSAVYLHWIIIIANIHISLHQAVNAWYAVCHLEFTVILCGLHHYYFSIFWIRQGGFSELQQPVQCHAVGVRWVVWVWSVSPAAEPVWPVLGCRAWVLGCRAWVLGTQGQGKIPS